MSMVKGLIGVAVAVIIGIGVAVPITSSVVASANLTGTDSLIAGFLTTLIVVAILIGIVSLFS
jgi:hypothetical protein